MRARIDIILTVGGTSLMTQMVRHLPSMQETRVQSLGWEDLLEKEMATHCSILAWKIPWMEEPGTLQSMGLQRVGHDWAGMLRLSSKGLLWWLSDKESVCQCKRRRRLRFSPCVGKIPWRRKWQPTPVFLPEKSHGQRSLLGYSPWGHKSIRNKLATKEQQSNK